MAGHKNNTYLDFIIKRLIFQLPAIGQDESTCVVYGMPKVAYDIRAVEFQEKLPDIAKRTYAILSKM